MLSYTTLRDIQRKETEAAALTTLEKDFYKDISDLLLKKKEEAFSTKSILAIKEYENIRKVILAIRVKREEKIVLMALRSETESDALTKEEQEMLREFRLAISSYRKTLDDILVYDRESTNNIRKVKILKDVERYKGINNMVYGPFRIGEEQFLPVEEVEWLLKSRLAESI